MGMLRRSTLWLGVLFIQGCSPSTQPPANAVDAQERGDSTQ
jgi:PBP1b-binding outer membrane lipoprotein LpoB